MPPLCVYSYTPIQEDENISNVALSTSSTIIYYITHKKKKNKLSRLCAYAHFDVLMYNMYEMIHQLQWIFQISSYTYVQIFRGQPRFR